MVKFERFDPKELIRGLAEAALQIQAEELLRDGRMPSLEQVLAVIDETRQKYQRRILAARQMV